MDFMLLLLLLLLCPSDAVSRGPLTASFSVIISTDLLMLAPHSATPPLLLLLLLQNLLLCRYHHHHHHHHHHPPPTITTTTNILDASDNDLARSANPNHQTIRPSDHQTHCHDFTSLLD
ncbi:hypothetical protein K504DRAFT_112432 [Pleomassaria siparia CBS 279.74]|uniref:Secreted protein n=1 Tax=Pleomassaria siparia CBS 279.74 TaxID=1314801 RepID=A0A6G1JW86_9PLEO|nr:hypothetical protein K504DRAFT_112432 [Pleomassaria siparia CBS 279.74]